MPTNNKSIQILRGNKSSLSNDLKKTKLEPGQPFFDKDAKTLQVGDGSGIIGDGIEVNGATLATAPYVTVKDGAITTSKLHTGAVTTDKLHDASNSGNPTGITTRKIENNAVDGTKIAAGAIDNTKVAPDADIDGTKFKDNSISGSKLHDADGSSGITTGKIEDNAITTAKILNGNVTPSKLGTIVEGSSISKSANGLSVTLSQDANKGLSIDFTGSSVTQSDTVKCDKASTTTYLCGTSSDGYITPKYIEALQVSANGTLTSSGSIEATSFNATSDIRLKDNIKTSSMDATNIVSTIDIVDFNYKANPNVKQFGVIAQALKEVCPEVVVEGEDGYLRIKESKLVYILWKALQDANERITNLEAIVYSRLSNK